MNQLALERLQRAASDTPADQRSADLNRLLAGFYSMQQASRLLGIRGAKGGCRLPRGTPAAGAGASVSERVGAAAAAATDSMHSAADCDQEAAEFVAMVHLLRALATSMEACNMCMPPGGEEGDQLQAALVQLFFRQGVFYRLDRRGRPLPLARRLPEVISEWSAGAVVAALAAAAALPLLPLADVAGSMGVAGPSPQAKGIRPLPPAGGDTFAGAYMLLSAGISACWAGASNAALLQLQAHSWVPTAKPPGSRANNSSSSRASAGGSSSSSSGGSSSGSSSSSSSSVRLDTTPAAAALAAALAHHCPQFSPADVLRWALVMRISVGASLVGEHEARAAHSPAWPSFVRGLLTDAQWLLDVSAASTACAAASGGDMSTTGSSSGGGEAAGCGCGCGSGSGSAAGCGCGSAVDSGHGGLSVFALERSGKLLESLGADYSKVRAVEEEALACALQNKCWLPAAEVAHALVVSKLGDAVHLPGRRSQAGLLAAEQLVSEMRRIEAESSPWMPGSTAKWIQRRRRQAEQMVHRAQAAAAQGRLRGLRLEDLEGAGPSRVDRKTWEDARSTCAFCSDSAMELKLCAGCRCVSYCSRECQVQHWKQGGHKQECASMAAAKLAASGASN